MATSLPISPKPTVQHVKFISKDGYEFIVQREVAYQSKVLKGFVDAWLPSTTTYSAASRWSKTKPAEPTEAPQMPTITLEYINGAVLDLIMQYLTERFASNATMSDFLPLQQLDPEKESDRQLVLDLLLAADFLEC